MKKVSDPINRRVLVIEDDPAVQRTVRAILTRPPEIFRSETQAPLSEAIPFDPAQEGFEVDCADRGQTGLGMVQTALQEGRAYALAFVDMRLPSGWDGTKTIEHIWRIDPEIQIVICTAYSDHEWNHVLGKVGRSDQLLILRKPFDAIEVWQLANSLTHKWHLAKKAQQQLDSLNSLVDQRTAELKKANERLQHDIDSRRLVEAKLTEALDHSLATVNARADFLSMMSHEIRSPMTGVLGMTGLLLDTNLTAEQLDYVETIHSSGQALLTIINDVLDFSKIDAGKLKLEIIDFDPRTTVEEVVKLLAGKAHKKGLELACLMPAELPQTLRGDPGRLRQILINLIDNAVKFTPQGEVLVRVTLAESTPEEVVVRFEVSDSGIGISLEAQARLFQSFSQADNSITRKYGGTGLGLVICKRLIELMGGQIGLESEVGRGSTFWVSVPLAKQPARPPREPLRLAALQGVRACIVAQNATTRRTLEHDLSHWGLQALSVEDGSTALAFLRAAATRGEPCELALLDMPIPDMDAFELARVVKTDPALAHVRLVMLTSFGQRGQAKAAREAGFSAYLTKPLRHAQLYECLATVMGALEAAGQGVERGGAPTASPLVTRHTLDEAQARSRPRILVADDSIVDQKVAVRMLEKLGYQAHIANNGREALEALADTRVDYEAVLMDWHMPEMDGLAVTAEIRQREGPLRHMPIIVMTANAVEGDREKCLQAGTDEYLPKPISLDQLAAVIQRCRDKSVG